MMNITIASLTDQGTRASNQDHNGEIIGERSACFVVCDGVAGAPGGEVAAALACNTILESFDGDKSLDTQDPRQFIQRANRVIRTKQQLNIECSRMGTTLVSLFIDRDTEQAYWAHAGDSRLYLFRRGYMHNVTTDHSLLQRMKDAGHETDGVNSNFLYYALGIGDDELDASYSDVVPLQDGDVFLLCTDGFWQLVSQQQMQQSLHMVNTPEEWLTMMQQVIRQRSESTTTQDNYTAVAVWLGSPQDTTLLHTLSEAAQFIPFRD